MNKATKLKEGELTDLIIDSIQDIKGKEIVKLDLRNVEMSPADYFIICSGDSTTQVKAIAGNIVKRVRDEYGTMPNHTEGKDNSQWVLVDYFNIVVHVFHPTMREFYELEDLWAEATFTEYAEV